MSYFYDDYAPLQRRRPPPPQRGQERVDRYGNIYYADEPEQLALEPQKKPPSILDQFDYEKRPYFCVETEKEVDDFVIPVELAGIEFIFSLKDGSKVFGLIRHPKTLEHVLATFEKHEKAENDAGQLDLSALSQRVKELEEFKEIAMRFVNAEKDKPKSKVTRIKADEEQGEL